MAFDWDAENATHIALHEVQTGEAEQVLQNDPVAVQYQERDGEERAYPMSKRLEAVYFQER
ncbi:MAG: hypothetical protein LAP87_06505 [Acidobacteriia bacterium]|nr:hypothetical protein [Terriglobia bacterium]